MSDGHVVTAYALNSSKPKMKMILPSVPRRAFLAGFDFDRDLEGVLVDLGVGSGGVAGLEAGLGVGAGTALLDFFLGKAGLFGLGGTMVAVSVEKAFKEQLNRESAPALQELERNKKRVKARASPVAS